MKIQKSLPIIVTAALLVVVVIISAVGKNNVKSSAPTAKTAAATASQVMQTDNRKTDATLDDMRGVWVTYMELSMANESNKSEQAFRRKFTAIAARCKEAGFNTLVVQVRPFCDALYNSKLFPPSHIISGEQGKNAGYDPLKLMCGICRAQNLKIHAWVNPYRVVANHTPAALSDDNPVVKNKELALETDSMTILDPSNKDARKLITDGVMEIINQYDVDGVQFDDYFYPPDIEDEDNEQYQAYLKKAPDGNEMDLETWRMYNVDMLIAETYMRIHQSGKNVVFGISPQGNLGNNAEISADVVNWCGAKGFVDYICPQIYFSLDNPALSFENALADWDRLEFAEGVKMYVGLAGYKAGIDKDSGTWQNADDILADEYDILTTDKNVSGFMLYSYQSLNDEAAAAEIDHLISKLEN